MKNTLLALMCLSMLGSGCAMFNKKSEAPASMFAAPLKPTAAQIREAGRAMAAEVLREHPAIADQAIIDYVNKVGQYTTLHLAVADKAYKCTSGHTMMQPSAGFRVAVIGMMDEAKAFSVPNGTIFLTSALIGQMKSEDQLAGVIAHEAMHSICGDDLPNDIAKAALNPADAVAEIMARPFTHAELVQADRAAVVAMFKAGYYPNHYVRFVYENEALPIGRHMDGHERASMMSKDVAKLSQKIEKTVDARRARYEAFQRGVMSAAFNPSSPAPAMKQ